MERKARTKVPLNPEALEDRVLLSATWVDAVDVPWGESAGSIHGMAILDPVQGIQQADALNLPLYVSESNVAHAASEQPFDAPTPQYPDLSDLFGELIGLSDVIPEYGQPYGSIGVPIMVGSMFDEVVVAEDTPIGRQDGSDGQPHHSDDTTNSDNSDAIPFHDAQAAVGITGPRQSNGGVWARLRDVVGAGESEEAPVRARSRLAPRPGQI